MLKNAFIKDILRDIKKSKGRFLSIFAIVALGVAFFSGVKVAPIDMKKTADTYYDDFNLMDIRLLSTLGFTESDVNVLKGTDKVLGVFPTYSMDVITEYNSKESVLKLHSIPIENFNSKNEDYINRVNLIEGRYPEKTGECLIEKGKIENINIPIGSKIKLSSGNDSDLKESLKEVEYEVVGIVETPYYLSYEKGNSTIGNGKISSFIIIPQEDIKLPVFTEIFLTIDGAKDINSYNKKYFNVIDDVKEEIENLGLTRANIRYEEVLKEANDKISSSKSDFATEKEKANKELENAKMKIDSSREELALGEEELNKKESEFNNFVKESEAKLIAGETELSNAESAYKDGLKKFNESKKIAEEQFKLAEAEIKKLEDTKNSLELQIDDINNKLQDPTLSEEVKIELQTKLQQLQLAKNEVEDGILKANTELKKNKDTLISTEANLTEKGEILKKSREDLNNKKADLENGKIEALNGFKTGREKIATGKAELKKGEEEFEKAKNTAEEEFALAESKIRDAEEAIENIEKPKWYVLDRNSHYSYVDYGNAANSIDALAKIFPVFFFLVAALICLTTMTRMVDEQRVNIGTLKALGYSKATIASKYIVYAMLASLGGSILGLAIGFTIFPSVVFNAYEIMYTLPSVILEFNIPLALGITLVGVMVTTLAAFSASYKELLEDPSILMRPRAPKNGKRILIERIPFIWNKLNFIGKVTVRNIFRYKKRFFMTVFGIGGCTALLITGFGIKDSIETIVDRQFSTIFKYDMTITLDNKVSVSEKNDVLKVIEEDSRIKESININKQNIKLSFNDITKEASIIVTSDLDKFDNFIHLENRKTKDPLQLQDKGIIISEKLAKQLKVTVGDNIELENSNGKKGIAEVIGITENYTFNYVYTSKDYYEEIFRTKYEVNSILASLNETSKEFEENLSKDIITEEVITGVSFNSALKNTFHDTIRSLNYVVLIMILSAGALAFVVLYNLTNVNISERMREIATIKVLGFYDKEVSAYIYRENIILTIIGTILGLGMGVLLHNFIMITVEIDNMMFGRRIDLSSFIISAGLTLLFAALVNLAMYYKLKKIKMVESLKSVD